MAKKNDEVTKLTEELLINRKNGTFQVSDEKLKKADEFCESYKTFLDESKTEREVVIYTLKAAKKAGFKEFDPSKTYEPGDKVYCNNRDRAVILAVIGKNGCKNAEIYCKCVHVPVGFRMKVPYKKNASFASNRAAANRSLPCFTSDKIGSV